MHARSAVFAVYGDLLAETGHRTSVAQLVRLLAPVGIAAPAVRTAVSRMVTQGWLAPARLANGRGYTATEVCVERLHAEQTRFERHTSSLWDGQWHVVVVAAPEGRTARARLTRELGALGYGALEENVWINPQRHPDLESLLETCDAHPTEFLARELPSGRSPLRAFDLDALARAFNEWLCEAEATTARLIAAHPDTDEGAYAALFTLRCSWRSFRSSLPGIPHELLPSDWPSRTAERYVRETTASLTPGADRFIARVLGTRPVPVNTAGINTVAPAGVGALAGAAARA